MKDLKMLINKIRTDYEYGMIAWEVVMMVGLLFAYIEKYCLPGMALYVLAKVVMMVAMIGMTYHVFFRRNR